MAKSSLHTKNSVFYNRFCPKNHDKTVSGVYADYTCIACKAERNQAKRNPSDRHKCKHGHDKRVVGVSEYGACLACKKEHSRNYRHPGIQSVMFRYCAWMHDKFEVGVGSSGQCKECKRIYDAVRHGRLDESVLDRSRWIYLPNLKKIREEMSLSREAMGQYCGLDSNTIARLEECRIKASVEAQKIIVEGVRRAQRAVIRERRLRGDIYGAKLGRGHAA